MRVLVTGGSGNLGRYVARELADHGHAPFLFDRVAPDEGPRPFQSPHPFLRGELTSADDCLCAVREAGAQAIVHLGAIPHATDHPDASVRNLGPSAPADATFRINTLGSYYLLEAARQAAVPRLVMASSYFVLGLGFRISPKSWRAAYLPIDERHPTEPEDSYSLSKLLNEQMLAAHSRAWGCRTVALRLLGVWYPHRAAEIPAGYFGGMAQPEPHFDGWMYLDARDAAQAFRLAVERDDLPAHSTFFVATDTRLGEPARDAIARVFPYLAGQASWMGPDDWPISIEAAKRGLGYQPRHSWRRRSAAALAPTALRRKLGRAKALARRLSKALRRPGLAG